MDKYLQLQRAKQMMARNRYLQQARQQMLQQVMQAKNNFGQWYNKMFNPYYNPTDDNYNPILERTMIVEPNGRQIPYYDYIGAD